MLMLFRRYNSAAQKKRKKKRTSAEFRLTDLQRTSRMNDILQRSMIKLLRQSYPEFEKWGA